MKIITLNSFLGENLCKMIDDGSFIESWGQSFISEILLLCANYFEEGKQLFLDVYLLSDIDDFLKIIPGSSHVIIGKTQLNENGAKAAIKRCAPLVRGCWRMFFVKDIDGMTATFGVFRDIGCKLNMPLEQIIQNIDPDYTSFVHISHYSSNAIKIVNSSGYKAVLHLSNTLSESIDVSAIESLVDAICVDIVDTEKSACKFYLMHLLSKVFRDAHGVLLAVIKGESLPLCLTDSVAIDLPGCFSSILSTASSIGSDASIRALEDILYGVFQCDGIVVFNTSSKLLAYNAFTNSIGAGATGGARRRAFESLCQSAEPSLKAVYYQSQDGLNELWRSS